MLDAGGAIGLEVDRDDVETQALECPICREAAPPQGLSGRDEPGSLGGVHAGEGTYPGPLTAGADFDQRDDRPFANQQIHLEAPDTHVAAEHLEPPLQKVVTRDIFRALT
jgi:hypothetical protein